MVLIALAVLGFVLARFTSMIVTFAVGVAMLCALALGFWMVAMTEVPPLAQTSDFFEFYGSAVITSASGFLFIGFALATTAYVLGAYLVGAVAGRVALRWQEQKT